MRLLFVITELDEGGAEQVFERVVRAAGKKHVLAKYLQLYTQFDNSGWQ